MNTDDKKNEMSPDERIGMIKSKRNCFKEFGSKCLAEYDDFKACDKCKFLSETCHKTCGVIMKHISKIA